MVGRVVGWNPHTSLTTVSGNSAQGSSMVTGRRIKVSFFLFHFLFVTELWGISGLMYYVGVSFLLFPHFLWCIFLLLMTYVISIQIYKFTCVSLQICLRCTFYTLTAVQLSCVLRFCGAGPISWLSLGFPRRSPDEPGRPLLRPLLPLRTFQQWRKDACDPVHRETRAEDRLWRRLRQGLPGGPGSGQHAWGVTVLHHVRWGGATVPFIFSWFLTAWEAQKLRLFTLLSLCEGNVTRLISMFVGRSRHLWLQH